MLLSITVVAIILVFVIVMAFYKRRMLIQMFSLNVAESANKFNEELEKTANIIIKRLETQISHLEYLLDEADAKIAFLEKQIQYNQTSVPNSIPSASAPTENLINNPDINQPAQPLRQEKNALYAGIYQSADTVSQTQDTVNADKRNLIMAMANQGYNVTEIAKTTGLGKGEVMLLLQLNKK